jgi:hypothetical protein
VSRRPSIDSAPRSTTHRRRAWCATTLRDAQSAGATSPNTSTLPASFSPCRCRTRVV